jgi:hypothetical protein
VLGLLENLFLRLLRMDNNTHSQLRIRTATGHLLPRDTTRLQRQRMPLTTHNNRLMRRILNMRPITPNKRQREATPLSSMVSSSNLSTRSSIHLRASMADISIRPRVSSSRLQLRQVSSIQPILDIPHMCPNREC